MVLTVVTKSKVVSHDARPGGIFPTDCSNDIESKESPALKPFMPLSCYRTVSISY